MSSIPGKGVGIYCGKLRSSRESHEHLFHADEVATCGHHIVKYKVKVKHHEDTCIPGALYNYLKAVNGMWSGIFHCPNEPVGGLPPSNIPSLRQVPAESSGCPLKCMIKAGVFVLLTIFVLYLPLGDPYTHCLEPYRMYGKQLAICSICDLYLVSTEVACKSLEVSGEIYKTVSKLLYESKLKFYGLLDTIDRDDLCRAICCSDSTSSLDLGTMKERRACKCMKKCRLKSDAQEMQKDDVDKVLEDEITHKLGEDLLQSVERKFQVDLERSVDMVLIKIKLLLQNGTQHIQDKLLDIQGTLDTMKSLGENEVEICLTQRQNETSALAEKALHQMVVCGYALIGQDPAQAVHKVVSLKNMIKTGVKPLYEQKKEIYGLLKVCGHDHDSLKKVVKCVISKSPLIKSVMMEISGKLINGVVDLTKLMAHGAMHEACLIEVIKTIEDEAVELIKTVKKCAFGNENFEHIEKYLNENNAAVLDIPNEASIKNSGNLTNVKEIKHILQRMMQGKDGNSLDDTFKDKLMKLQNDLDAGNVNINAIPNDLNKGVE